MSNVQCAMCNRPEPSDRWTRSQNVQTSKLQVSPNCIRRYVVQHGNASNWSRRGDCKSAIRRSAAGAATKGALRKRLVITNILSMGEVPESQGDSGPKPRVGAPRLPWECSQHKNSPPTGLRNPFGIRRRHPMLLSLNLLAGCEDFLPLPTSRTCLTPAMAAPWSADLQSAVSPNCIRPSVVQL